MISFIKRYEKCWILSFPSIGRWKIEIVYAPSGYEIREHSHDNQDITLIPLFVNETIFWRRKRGNISSERVWATWSTLGKAFTIPAGYIHGFSVSRFPLLFLNIERYKEGFTPTSAVEDFNIKL